MRPANNDFWLDIFDGLLNPLHCFLEPEETGKPATAEEPEPAAVAPVLTESQLNALAAKILKAEIMGNDDVVAELKAKLDSAKAARADYVAQGGDPERQEEKEIVTKIQFHDTKTKRKKTKVETHKDGQRIRYFGDDDKYDLQQMYEREKMDTAEDQAGHYIFRLFCQIYFLILISSDIQNNLLNSSFGISTFHIG